MIVIILLVFIFYLYHYESFNTTLTPIYYKKNKFNRVVYAGRKIKKNEVIEISPTIYIESITNVPNILIDYIFSNNEKYYIAFGCGSMFNHSDEPNIHWKFTKDNNIKFTANKNINKNTELTINYGKPYWKARKKIKN